MMANTVTDFLKIIYTENDLSRGFATSVTGVLALICYVKSDDVYLSILTIVIFYPISRILFLWIMKAYTQNVEKKKIKKFFDTFSLQEEILMREFVSNGSSFLDFSYINRYQNEIESLKNRGILFEVSNGFQLNIKVFDKAKEIYDDAAIPF